MTEIGYTRSEFLEKHYTDHIASIEKHLKTLTAWAIRSKMIAYDWRDVGDAAHVDDLLAMACEFLEMEPETKHPLHAPACQVCGRPDMLSYICEPCYEDRCA